MELRPQDLDDAYRETLLQMREGAETRDKLPAFLRKDQKRRDRRGFRFFPFLFLGVFAFHGGPHPFHWIWLLMCLLPLAFLRRRSAPVKLFDSGAPISLAEANALSSETESLEANYNMLLRSVIETRDLSASAQRNVYEALRDIGDLVAKLSGDPYSSILNDPVKIQRQAMETEERARLETDPVVAASLQRQAETLRGSAALAGQRATLRRWREAARGEVVTQIQSMQVSLESHALSGQDEQSDFAGLLVSIQQIAAEVNATLNAREEVRDAVETRYQEPPPPNTQKLGN